MLKYLTKFAMEIIPSVVATIIGAYIVNHYINTKPDSPPSTVASVASAAYAKLTGAKSDASKTDASASHTDATKVDAKSAETSAEVSNVPAPGIKAKGVSEKSLTEKAAEKAVEVKPAETASLPAETPRRAASPREKLIARGTPAEAPAAQPEERRDAADLARAAIERLRASESTGKASSEKPADAARGAGEAPRIVTATPPVSAVRPLPPPVTVSAPPAEQSFGMAPASGTNPPYTGALQPDGRPTPPAEIPTRQLSPLDLRADKNDPSIKDQMSNVAQDMMSAAKSVFHSVLPK
ncbi:MULTISPECIES: hypothetical protein [Bradyrhizobium]|jgi:hypothetical protein|uniref:Uncharacterized protein n=2 Tax=Bradyrhizobium TaxID=374 RepID=A0ABS5GAD9_9BRAD|nr:MULTISPECIES: hypothetical protein [Bradyrhizobium]MBR1138298.1 hypothetical protein [Bradyrhizobium denitrificans]MDU1496585.1 hypothetical protein [Bradyrhizobium sp.]MDU1546709.1 hypothetical protein [Bradyrhizobium sp.]MDU1689940.1 hypothetical protein [Bradyrhizobium sp.]MDU1807680.1 hypothetical protein [Bradyrhizobium sp.]